MAFRVSHTPCKSRLVCSRSKKYFAQMCTLKGTMSRKVQPQSPGHQTPGPTQDNLFWELEKVWAYSIYISRVW